MASPIQEALIIAEVLDDEGHDQHLVRQLRKALREAASTTTARTFDPGMA